MRAWRQTGGLRRDRQFRLRQIHPARAAGRENNGWFATARATDRRRIQPFQDGFAKTPKRDRAFPPSKTAGQIMKAAPPTQYDAAIRAAEERHGIPLGLLRALVQHESGFNPDAAFNGNTVFALAAYNQGIGVITKAREYAVDVLAIWNGNT